MLSVRDVGKRIGVATFFAILDRKLNYGAKHIVLLHRARCGA